MALEIDPIYHTETMVRILREQGSSLYAMELAEKILAKNPGHENVRQLLEEMKEEARASFERFRQAGRVEENSSEAEVDEARAVELADADEAPAVAVVELTDTEAVPAAREEFEAGDSEVEPAGGLPNNVVSLRHVAPAPEVTQVRLLKQLLTRVQEYRKVHGH